MYDRKFAAYENLSEFLFDGIGDYEIPLIKKDDITFDDFIGFNFAKSCKSSKDKCLHFYLDDYQFTRLWNRPNNYINLISQFSCVCSPDYSLYTDFPKAIQIYNHYRKHWLAAYWQLHGIKVIPTINWSDKDSFAWCFDGEPKNATVTISSVGTQNDKIKRLLFLQGYDEMMKRLEPKKIIFYGEIPKECYGNIVRVKAFQEKFREAKIDER